jgi:hypothetical protein
MRVAKLGLFLSLLIAGAAVADLPPGASSSASGDGHAAATAASPARPEILGLTDAADSPLAWFSYYYVLGAEMKPRTSTTTFAYDFNGCIHLTAGDNRLLFPLLLPEGSIVKFLRIYYDDTNAGVDLTAWLTRYDAGLSSTDLVSVASSGSAGYGTELSIELSVIFSSSLNYTLIVAPNVNDSTVQICGVRVAYYAPIIFRDGFESGGTSFWSLTTP